MIETGFIVCCNVCFLMFWFCILLLLFGLLVGWFGLVFICLFVPFSNIWRTAVDTVLVVQQTIPSSVMIWNKATFEIWNIRNCNCARSKNILRSPGHSVQMHSLVQMWTKIILQILQYLVLSCYRIDCQVFYGIRFSEGKYKKTI